MGDEERVFLVPVHGGEDAKVGTVAEVVDRVRLRGGARAVSLSGLHRGTAGAASTDADGLLCVEVEEHADEELPPVRTRELEVEYRAVVEEILELAGRTRVLQPSFAHERLDEHEVREAGKAETPAEREADE